jgi:hypothetical protein
MSPGAAVRPQVPKIPQASTVFSLIAIAAALCNHG